jgi:phenylacetate-coenzyme A ligase PaaK-like adenylate-forming protein
MLPDGRDYSQADLLFRGVKKFGATPVVAEMDIGVLALKKMVEEVQPTVIFGYTRHLFRLSRDLQLREDMRGKNVRTLFLAAEYLPPGMRSELEKIWGCSVHTHYGLTEMGLGVAVECDARNGYHFNEADLLLEVVNPHTGKPVEPGQEGELVFTTLNREAMPLIRYRTNDISRLIQAPCPCGAQSLLKIGAVKKRLGTILPIGEGDEIFPACFDDLLFEIPGIIDYQLIVTRKNNRDRLSFRIETMTRSSKTSSEIREKLLSSPLIARNIAAGTMAPPRIEMVGWGSLQTLGREKKMIIDSRD